MGIFLCVLQFHLAPTPQSPLTTRVHYQYLFIFFPFFKREMESVYRTALCNQSFCTMNMIRLATCSTHNIYKCGCSHCFFFIFSVFKEHSKCGVIALLLFFIVKYVNAASVRHYKRHQCQSLKVMETFIAKNDAQNRLKMKLLTTCISTCTFVQNNLLSA